MSLSFLLQTFGPVIVGLIFSVSGLLGSKPRWLGQLAFLLSQLVLIYALGYGSIAGIGLIAAILLGLALSVSKLRGTATTGGYAGAVAELVGIEVGVVSGVINLESSGVEASDWRLRHEQAYHEARFLAACD